MNEWVSVFFWACNVSDGEQSREQRFVPVDAMAHARDESGQEHERLPVWRLFTCDTAHVTVGPAITLRHRQKIHVYASLKLLTY